MTTRQPPSLADQAEQMTTRKPRRTDNGDYTPLYSLQAEQSVLASILQQARVFDTLADQLSADDFFDKAHQHIWNAFVHHAQTRTPIDIITVAETLEQHGHTADCHGGLPYLATLVREIPLSNTSRAHHAQLVRDHSLQRRLLATLDRIAQRIHHPDGLSISELIEQTEQQIYALADHHRRVTTGWQHINQLLDEALERLETLYSNPDATAGTQTGFTDFDDLTSGLQPGELIIIAGRPSMGKTSLAMNIAEHLITQDTPAPVAVFSMEMAGAQLAFRLLASYGQIDGHRMKSGRLTDTDWPRLSSAVKRYHGTPLYIDDTAALSPTDLRARARRLTRELRQPLGLIVIDYLQLMQIPGSHAAQRVTEISTISRSLKGLAKELNCPVIALSQLSRNLESRPNKRPIMSDLRESGAIEQDADLIAFVYRDEVYNPDTEYKGIAELIIAKQRNGPTGTIRLTWQGQHTRFANYITDSNPY